LTAICCASFALTPPGSSEAALDEVMEIYAAIKSKRKRRHLTAGPTKRLPQLVLESHDGRALAPIPKSLTALNKLGQPCANAFQAFDKHSLFTFKYETLHRNIDRVAAGVETHRAFSLSRGRQLLSRIYVVPFARLQLPLFLSQRNSLLIHLSGRSRRRSGSRNKIDHLLRNNASRQRSKCSGFVL